MKIRSSRFQFASSCSVFLAGRATEAKTKSRFGQRIACDEMDCVACPNFRMHLCCAEVWGQRCQMKPADNGILPIRRISPVVSVAIPTEPFINAKQASGLLHLSAKTLLRFARQGVIPAHPLTGKTRKQWRFLESELYAWAHQRVNLVTSDPCLNSRRK